jgi:hypothetical protein
VYGQGTRNSRPVSGQTIAKAFAALDAMSAQMARTGAPSDAIELIVVDDDGRQLRRPSSD